LIQISKRNKKGNKRSYRLKYFPKAKINRTFRLDKR
jgi:hypothetical protein